MILFASLAFLYPTAYLSIFCFAKLSIQLQGQCFTLEQYSLIRLFVKDYHVVKRILFN